MRKRIDIKNGKSDVGFVSFNIENEEELPKGGLTLKKSKVIGLGFQKMAQSRGLPKQHSMQLGVKGVVL